MWRINKRYRANGQKRGKPLSSSSSSLRIDSHIDVNLIIAVQEHKHPLSFNASFMHHAINELRSWRNYKISSFLTSLHVVAGHKTKITSWGWVEIMSQNIRKVWDRKKFEIKILKVFKLKIIEWRNLKILPPKHNEQTVGEMFFFSSIKRANNKQQTVKFIIQEIAEGSFRVFSPPRSD